MIKTLLENHYELRIESLRDDLKIDFSKYSATVEYLAKEHGWRLIWETISTSIFQFVLVLILSCLAAGVSGCASAYLATRNEVMRSGCENRDLEKTRTNIEKRCGKPISTVVNEDGTVTCTYEYSVAATQPAMKPLDSLGAFSGGGGKDPLSALLSITAFTLIESVAFTYYVVKDLAIRNSFRAVVTYNQEGIVVEDYPPPVEDFIPTEVIGYPE